MITALLIATAALKVSAWLVPSIAFGAFVEWRIHRG